MLNYRLPKEGFDSMNTRFTEQDRSILESYDSVVEGLADYLGMPPRSCCIVWKITSIPLSRLRTGIIREGNWERRSPIWLCKCCKRSNSPTRSRQSVILRGARTIVWWSRARSRSGARLGKLSDCCALTWIWMSRFLRYCKPLCRIRIWIEGQTEHFASSVEDMIQETIERTIEAVDASPDISYANRNKHIIGLLHERGVFNMRDAVTIVANALKITKHTVYLHLRNHTSKSERRLAIKVEGEDSPAIIWSFSALCWGSFVCWMASTLALKCKISPLLSG